MARKKYRKGLKRRRRPDKVGRFRVHWQSYFIITSVLLVFTSGVVGFMYLEPDMTILEAFHLTMQTITTVGYGDIELQTENGMLFSDILMVIGLGIATIGIASLLEFIVSGKLKEVMKSKDYEGMIARLRNHVIVCGYGRVGRSVVDELIDKDVPLVVLERNKDNLEDLDPDLPRIIGDSTQDDDLICAGLKKAVAVISATGDDADCLMNVVTVKYIKPEIIAIARSSVDEDKEKFQKVGADMVVSPETEGGKSMAKMLADASTLVIVAGYGRVGSSCAKELHSMGIPVMVMDMDEVQLETVPKDIDRMKGDVTKEEDLIKAGINKADALVSSAGTDAINLLATVTARYHRPAITVISRASSPEDVGKMLKVGADVVISPEDEGGKSMANWAVQAYHLTKGD